MTENQVILKIFVASPGDVPGEREILEEIVRELNLAWSDNLGVRLDLIRWETHVTPGMGVDAQDVINQQIPDDYDLFIGIMWTRFGSPTNNADSGTQEEFELAYKRHIESPKSLEIMFYFKDAPVTPSQIDISQLAKVLEFKTQLGKSGAFYHVYGSLEDFRSSVRLHLIRFLQRWRAKAEATTSTTSATVPLQENEPVTNRQPQEVDEEEGLLDLIERAEDALLRNRESVERITEVINVLGDKLGKRTQELERLKVGTPTNVKLAKRLINNAATDLSEFTERMGIEIDAFSESLSTTMSAFASAAILSLEVNPEEKDGLRGTGEAIASYRETIESSIDNIVNFRDIISAAPKMTTAFNVSRRGAVYLLDKFLVQIDTGMKQISDVENMLEDLLK